MKVSLLQENLNKGLAIVNKFVSTKIQLPVLANIFISAKNGKLKLSATNLETGINLWLAAKIDEEGEITIPAKIISEFVASLPQDKVVLKKIDSKLEINCRSYKASFNSIAASEFPPIISLKNKKNQLDYKTIILKKDLFIKAVNQIGFTAAIDESRPTLTGIKIDFLANKLQLVATDGYRLGLKTITLPQKLDEQSLIIPAKALLEVARVYLQNEEEELKLALIKKENQVIFSLGEVEIITRLLEGEYPDFQKIIPLTSTTEIILNKEEFQRAVKTASLFAKDSANIVRLKIKDQKLKISANSPEVGENEVELEIKQKGEDSQVAFNCRFLQDYLNSLEAEELILESSGPLKPGVFKPVNDASFLHLIMPVRLQE